MIYNILSYTIVIVLLLLIFYYDKYRVQLGMLFAGFIYFYYIHMWYQQFNVYPSINYKKLQNYNNKLLWINTNVLNVNNPKHVEWCKHVFIDSAPNILGIYIDNPNVENVFVSRQIEIFKIMFKHDPKHIYFKFDIDNNIRKFCKQKNLSITNIPFRYTI